MHLHRNLKGRLLRILAALAVVALAIHVGKMFGVKALDKVKDPFDLIIRRRSRTGLPAATNKTIHSTMSGDAAAVHHVENVHGADDTLHGTGHAHVIGGGDPHAVQSHQDDDHDDQFFL